MSIFSIHGVSAIIPRKIHGEKCILIQKRQKGSISSETGLLEIPCGKVKEQESSFDCLRNKVLIETGLLVIKIYGETDFNIKCFNQYEVINYVPFFSSQNIRDNYPITIETFICKTKGDPVLGSQDAKEIGWISLEKLKFLLEENEVLFYPMIVEPLKYFLNIEDSLMSNFYD